MTSQSIRLSTNFITLIPSLTFTDYEWFPWSICNGCGMPAGNAYPSGHLVPSPFWDLLMLQLLRPNTSNLPCLYSTFHLEYPLVLSRFCLSGKRWIRWKKTTVLSSWPSYAGNHLQINRIQAKSRKFRGMYEVNSQEINNDKVGKRINIFYVRTWCTWM